MKKVTIKLSDGDFEILHELIQSLRCSYSSGGEHYWETRVWFPEDRLQYRQRLLVDELKELFWDAKSHNGTICDERV